MLCVHVTVSGNFQIMKFSPESVAAFIAVLGILSIIAQVSLRQGRSDVTEGGPWCHPLRPRMLSGGALGGRVRLGGYRLRNSVLSGS